MVFVSNQVSIENLILLSKKTFHEWCRRSAIFASMIFQLIASVLMIITLAIYHGYTTDDPDPLTIYETLKNKDVAVVLLYISRFLSGWSAGK